MSADVNELRRRARDYTKEIHLQSRGCRYEIIYNHRMRVYILFRVCKCKKRTDKEHIRNNTLLCACHIGEGVEIHLDERCTYEEKTLNGSEIELTKLCYCPRDI